MLIKIVNTIVVLYIFLNTILWISKITDSFAFFIGDFVPGSCLVLSIMSNGSSTMLTYISNFCYSRHYQLK